MEYLRGEFEISSDDETGRLELAFKTALVEAGVEVDVDKLSSGVS